MRTGRVGKALTGTQSIPRLPSETAATIQRENTRHSKSVHSFDMKAAHSPGDA